MSHDNFGYNETTFVTDCEHASHAKVELARPGRSRATGVLHAGIHPGMVRISNVARVKLGSP